MQTTFILRLVDKDRRVLAWTRVAGESRGDGAIWPMQHFVAEADEAGAGTAIIVHWPEVNVHVTCPLGGTVPTQKGAVVTVPLRDPLIRIASEDRPLPGVTVRSSVKISPAPAGR